jgi:hypothetical protein
LAPERIESETLKKHILRFQPNTTRPTPVDLGKICVSVTKTVKF